MEQIYSACGGVENCLQIIVEEPECHTPWEISS